VVAGTVAAAALIWAGRLAADPRPYAAGPGAVLAASLAGLGLLCVVGILIARARWARPLALGLSGVALLLGAVSPLGPVTIAGIVLGGLALTAAAGPWLGSWLRRLPSAEGPSALAVGTIFALLGLPAWTALVRSDGFGAVDWLLVAAGPILALGISRAAAAALWGARLGLPILAAAALLADGLPSGLLVAAGAVACAALAWRGRLRTEVSPLIERRPPVPFPPELVSPDLLRAAGFDDGGRPREEP
jgi:hypothetical protein